MPSRHPSFGARDHRTVGGTLADGVALATGVAVSALIPLAGSSRFRIRIKASAAGTLSSAFVRPGTTGFDAASLYTTGNPTDVAVVANTETKLEISEHYGEALLLLTYTPSGNGTLTFCDVCEL